MKFSELLVAALLFAGCSSALASSVVRSTYTGLPDEISCEEHSDAEWSAAIAALTEKIQADSSNYELFAMRGLAYSCEHNDQQAIADFDKAIAIMPTAPRTWYVRAISYMQLGDATHAIADFTQAIALNPKYVQAFNNRGTVYERTHDIGRAIADYSAAINLLPTYADAYVNRGRAYSAIASTELAKADYARALELDPKDAFAYINLGALYFRERDYASAIADFDKAHALMPQEPSALLDSCQARAWANTELDRALQDCNASLALRPNSNHTLRARELAFLRKGQYDAAIMDGDNALIAAPNDAQAMYLRGVAKLRQGKTVDGNADLLAAQALMPSVDRYFANIGIAP